MLRSIFPFGAALLLSACSGGSSAPPPYRGEIGTILFVTQVPQAGFATVTSTFANHVADPDIAPRGGSLMIRYPDGTLRDLTAEAGYGDTGQQGANAIAVREPCVHFDGNKALFSMVVGAPTRQYEVKGYVWQIYEVTGLGRNDHAVITRVPRQPESYNNVAPFYASDDRVLFASDRPRNGEEHLYPQLDEYESARTTSGLWSLDPVTGELILLNHAPSGVFSPSLDSFGRVVFTKWDHLQRDQQADADRDNPTYGAFTYADESAGAARIADLTGAEVFPEPRDANDPDVRAGVSLHTFNQFFPWQIHDDGTGEETLNHVGRHELGGTYVEGSFTDDPNLTYLISDSIHLNRFRIRGDGGLFHMREDPRAPGTYFVTYSPEFGTASTGMLLKLLGAPDVNAEDMVLTPITHPDTYSSPENPDAAPQSTGRYRNPLPLSDGTLVAVHTTTRGPVENTGTRAAPSFPYELRLKVLKREGDLYVPGAPLTPGIRKRITWWDPDALVTFDGVLWELDPVEVRPSTRPAALQPPEGPPELAVLGEEGIDEATLRSWLVENGLALLVSRNVTLRDRADVQQPFNLRVPNGASAVAKTGKVYDIGHLQFFQGDAVRGYGGVQSPNPGRRLLPRPMHDPAIVPATGGPLGSVPLAADGSMAAFVPARRALAWQLVAPDGTPVVRERNWVSFQPGEIRTCPSCHGINRKSQLDTLDATNEPEALRALLREWKTRVGL